MSDYIGGNWNRKEFVIFNSNAAEFKISSTSLHLAVLITSRQLKISSPDAGRLYQFVDTPFGKASFFKGEMFVPLNRLVIFELARVSKSLLRFEPAKENLPLNLTILEPTMPLYPITSDPTPIPTASSSFVSATVAVASSSAVKLLGVNTSRKAFTVYNPDKNNSIYADVISTVSSSVASFVVPPGQVYISDFDWTGEVWGITKSGNVNATVREFT